MSYLLAILCILISIYDRMTGNVLECGQMAIAAGVFAVSGNIGALIGFLRRKENNNTKEIQNEREN